MTVRESPDELTLRAEEVGTWKSHINAFSQALYKGIEGADWRELYNAYKDMSRAVGGQEAAGGPESKSPFG